MTRVGIIIDKYHLKYKVEKFLKYLKKKAHVKIYLEEKTLVNFKKVQFNEDIFFVKAKGNLVLYLAKLIEQEISIPVINSYKGIFLAINRFLNSLYLKKAGILVPRFSLTPIKMPPPFNEYIIKNIIDQKNYSFKPEIKKNKGHLEVMDERAFSEAINSSENYRYLYYQEFIKSKWEYKVYTIGDKLFFYKQIPVLVNPDKLKTRREIEEIPELRSIVIKVNKVIGLKISSLDFLKTIDGNYYLTDVNPTPNFNYIKNGHEIVADYLIEQVKC